MRWLIEGIIINLKFSKMKANKRKEKDVMKLLTSDYEIEIKEDNMSEFTVILDGPPDSPYEGVSFEKI